MIVILKTADFSSENIGTVTIPEAELYSLAIRGESSYIGTEATLAAIATYDDSTFEDVTASAIWSITSGSSYATISDGVLTILPAAATASNVTVSASYTSGSTTKTATKTVSVTYDLGLDAFTKAAITASGNNSMTSAQKLALDAFFKKLGAYGTESSIWGKMSRVYIPLIADDVAYALINYVDNTADAAPDSSTWGLRTHGLVNKTSTAAYITTDEESSAWDATNLSVFAMRTEAISEKLSFLLLGALATGRLSFDSVMSGNDNLNNAIYYNTGNQVAAYQFASVPTSTDTLNLMGFSLSSGSLSRLSASKLTTTTVSTVPTIESGKLFVGRGLLSMSGPTSANPPIGLIMVGSALTDEEMTTLKAATETLRDAFLV